MLDKMRELPRSINSFQDTTYAIYLSFQIYEYIYIDLYVLYIIMYYVLYTYYIYVYICIYIYIYANVYIIYVYKSISQF